MPKAKPYTRESDLCAAFVAAIDTDVWTSYAETGGWDLLLVRKQDGYQIGIQAKLKLNAMVLAQCLDEYASSVDRWGPDYRAILVPVGEVNVGLSFIAAYIGITVLRMEAPAKDRKYGVRAFAPGLPGLDSRTEYRASDWFECCPVKRCVLPEYVPDVIAGGPAPLQVTQWKIKAIKLAVLLEERGYVTRKDFSHLQLDHRLWLNDAKQWLRVVDGNYVAGTCIPDFKKLHPIVYSQVKADIDRWRPPAPLPLEPQQPALL